MEICVRLLDDSKLHITLHQDSSALTLKSYIQVRDGLPIPLQSLFARGKVLTDDEKISKYSEEEIAVKLDSAARFPLQFTIVLASGISYPIKVLLRDTVQKMKEEIAAVMGVPCGMQRLFNRGKLLLDSQTVSEVYRPGNFLCYLLLPSDYFIEVTTAFGQCFQVPTCKSDRLSRVIDFLREHCAFDCRGQTITCSGEKVGSLAALRILKSRQITCVGEGFWVWIETLDVPGIQVPLRPFDSIIPAISCRCSRLPEGSSPWVLYSGRVLGLSASVHTEKLASGSILEYGDLLLHVRSFNIEKIVLAVPSDSYVSALKRELAKRLHKDSFKLMYYGCELPSGRTLASCGMQRTATVEVVDIDSVYVWCDFGGERELRELHHSRWRRSQPERIVFNGTAHNHLEDAEFSGGGVIYFPEASANVVIACKYGGKVYRAVMRTGDTVAALATALKAVFPLREIEGVSDDLEVVKIPRRRVRISIDSRRLLGCRFRDGRVHWVSLYPGMKVADLKEKLMGRRYPAAIVYKDCCLRDIELISDWQIAEGELVDVCQDGEIVLCGEGPKNRYITPLPQSCTTLSDLYSLCKPLFPGPLLLFSSSLLLSGSKDLLELGVCAGTCIHAISTASSIAVHTMSPDADKFIYLRRRDGAKCVLLFHHSTIWSELLLFIRMKLCISQFSLVLDGKMMTSYRFHRVLSGAVVEVIVSTEAVAFCHSDGTVSFVPAPTATVERAKATAHASGKCYCRGKLISESTLKLKEVMAEGGVVHCVPETHRLMRLDRVDMEATYVSVPKAQFTASGLIERIRISECDPDLHPTFLYLPSKTTCCYNLFQHKDLNSLKDKSLLMLLPPQVFIVVSRREHGNFSLFMTRSDEIWKVRKAVAGKIAISSFSLRLYYKESLLVDDSISLESHGISQHCEIMALQPGDILVRINCKTRKVTSIESLNCPISSLLRSVCKSLKVSRSGSSLQWKDWIMDNQKTIQDYTDSGEVDLQLLRGTETLVCVTVDGSECMEVARRVEVSYSFLKRMSGYRVSDRDTLLWAGELKDSLTVSDYHLSHDSELFMLCSPRTDTTVKYLYVRFSDGRKVKVRISNHATVAEAVQTIRSRAVSDVKVLLINEEIAEENKLVIDYGVANGTEVYALLAGERVVEVLFNGSLLLLPAKSEVSISSIKTMVEARTSIPASMQNLLFHKELLCDGTKIGELEDNSCLELHKNADFVCVRTVHFHTAVPRPGPKDTVREWKTQLERIVKVPSDQQRVLVDDRETKDDEVIEHWVEKVVILGATDIRVSLHSPFSTASLYVSTSDSIALVKKRIKQHRLCPFRPRLLAEIRIKDNKTLSLLRNTQSLRARQLLGGNIGLG